MEITIKKDGVEQKINLSGLTGADILHLTKSQIKIQSSSNATDALLEYAENLDVICSKITRLTIPELNALDVEDKEKIIEYIKDKTRSSMGF